MVNFETERPLIIKAWERKRIRYNLLLILPTLFGFTMGGSVSSAVGDQNHLSGVGLGAILACLIIAANLCYSLIYAFEFIFWNPKKDNWWHKNGFRWIYWIGTILAMFLAVAGGRELAFVQYGIVRLF